MSKLKSFPSKGFSFQSFRKQKQSPSDSNIFEISVLFCINSPSILKSIEKTGHTLSQTRDLLENGEQMTFSVEFLSDVTALKSILFKSPTISEALPHLVIASDSLAKTREDGKRIPGELAEEIRNHYHKLMHPIALLALEEGYSKRISDIDGAVDVANSDEKSILNEFRRVSRGLRLKFPPSKDNRSHKDSTIIVHAARSLEDMKESFRLRYSIYNIMGYLDEKVSGCESEMEIDSFDRQSFHFIAKEYRSGEVVGTARLIMPDIPDFAERSVIGNPRRVLNLYSKWCREIARSCTDSVFRRRINAPCALSLPILQSGDFREKWSDILSETEDGCEFSRLVVAQGYRGLGVSQNLMRVAMATAYDLRRKFVLLECVPSHASMYEKYGFVPRSEYHCRNQDLDQKALGMRADFTDEWGLPCGIAKKVLQIIVEEGHPQNNLFSNKFLCQCGNVTCWDEGNYAYRGRPSCPISELRRS